MKNIDTNPSSHTSADAPVHSKDTVLMITDWEGSNRDEMETSKTRFKNVSGGASVLSDFKTRL